MTKHPQYKYRWMEVAAQYHDGAQSGMCRNKYIVIDDPASLTAWRVRFNNADVYTSICRFIDCDYRSSAICPLFCDIDAHNKLDLGRDQVLRICDLLHNRLGIDPESIDLFFSGRGYHIEVTLEVYGNPTHPRVVKIWQHLARRLSKEGLDLIDTGIYQTNRLWRLVNSRNSKSDLYKVPIEFKELQDMGIDYILEIARQPREFESMAIPCESPKAVRWLQESVDWLERRDKTHTHAPPCIHVQASQWPPCIRSIEEQAFLLDGSRHHTYFKIACFYALIGMAPQESVARLTEIDQRNPIRDPDYIERVAQSAAKYRGFRGCPNETLKGFCDPDNCFLNQTTTRSADVVNK